jgi:hypothetical protein
VQHAVRKLGRDVHGVKDAHCARRADAATRAEIILGNLFRFDDISALKDGHLNLMIVAPREVKQEQLKVSAKVFYDPNLPPRRFVIPPNSFSWAERDGKTYNECAFEMPEGHLALVIVSYEGEFCHKWWLRDQSKSFSQRFQFHRLLDIDNTIEKTFFDSKNDFEDRVALLLSLMNLRILPMVEFLNSKMLPTYWPTPATTIYMLFSAQPATSTKEVSCNGCATAREI